MRTTAVFASALIVSSLCLACRDEPGTPLAIAAAAGRTSDVAELVTDGADVDGIDASGMTALGWAARFGNVASMDALIAAGATVDLPEASDVWPPLLQALHKNHNAAALRLLEAGASVEGRTGPRALEMAAGYGNAELVRALLAAGVEPSPEILVEAVGGAWDIDYSWRGCEPHTETVHALLAASPELRMPDGLWSRLAARHARRERCTEILAMVRGNEGDDRVSEDVH